jgi:Ca2+-transporting ATPase
VAPLRKYRNPTNRSLLVAAGVIYLVLNEHRDSLVLLISIFAIPGIDLCQQNKTERVREALDLSSPRALVIRDGLQTRIAGREVVRGDMAILSEGDRVPADGAVLSCVSLSVDESLPTREPVPVGKSSGNPALKSLPLLAPLSSNPASAPASNGSSSVTSTS